MVRTWRILYIYPLSCKAEFTWANGSRTMEDFSLLRAPIHSNRYTGWPTFFNFFSNRLDKSNSWSLGSVYAASSAAFFNLHFPDIGGKDESGDCNLTVLLLDSIYWMDLHWRSPRRFVKILLNSAAILWIFKLWWFGLVRNDNRFQCCFFFFFLFF